MKLFFFLPFISTSIFFANIQFAAAGDVSQVYAYPTPFKSGSGHTVITFTNLPTDGNIKIYNSNGELVRKIDFTATSGTGAVDWNVKNTDGEDVASDVYLYIVQSGSNKKTGKLLILR